MSDEEGFLNRWSRRKQQAEKEVDADPAPAEKKSAEESAEATAGSKEEEFDVSTLPPIDSITAGTDIRAFLSKGVPASLTQAALRRAWSADPAIRDYIGLSEYSWDFNAPGQFGFGELDPTLNVQEMVADMFGEIKKAAANVEDFAHKTDLAAPAEFAPEQVEPVRPVELQTDSSKPESIDRHENAHFDDGSMGDKSAQLSAASQQEEAPEEEMPAQVRRHGSALPT